MNGKDKTDVRVVRPVDRSVLGSEKADFVPLSITDDRNKNPLYAMWLCDDCGKFYDVCICAQLAEEERSSL